MDRAEQLKAFIEGWKDTPVTWGESDCTAYAAKWVETVTGCLVPRLATYSSREEAHDAIAHHGGLLALWDASLSSIGIYQRYYEPELPGLGDVAIVRTADYGDIGVIVANDGTCVLRTETGTRFLRPRSFVKVWAI